MSVIDVVRAFMNALEANELDTAAAMLADSFTIVGWTPRPLDKQAFLGVIKELKAGIPGLIYNLHNLQEEGETVTGNIQVAGYQTDSFSIPELSLPPIPQMGRSISMPVEDVRYLVQDDKISRWFIQRVDGGGIQGLLHQLGFDAPIIQ